MPDIRWGTFAGKNIVPTSLVGTAQLAPKNQVTDAPTIHGRQFGSVNDERTSITPDVNPGVDNKGGSPVSKIATTTEARGARANPTLGDTPVSHVTPEPVFITPEQYSRENREWEGNVTGNTIPKTSFIVQKIVPSFGMSGAGSLNGTGGV